MTQQPPPMSPYGENRPPAGSPPTGQVPQPRQPGYGPPVGQPGYPVQPGQPGYPAHPGYPPQPGYPAPQPGYPVSGQPGAPIPSGPPPGYQYPQHPGYGRPVQPGWPGQLPTPSSPAGQPLASFGDRLLAVLIDGAITGAIGTVLTIPFIVIYFIWMGSTVGDFETQPDGTITTPGAGSMLLPLLLLYVGIFGVSLLVAYLYYVEFNFRRGQTVGKRTMKIKIVTFDPAGTVTRGVLVKRYGAQLLCGFLPAGGLLDGLWQLWDKPYQQCLHDKAGKTLVVKVPA